MPGHLVQGASHDHCYSGLSAALSGSPFSCLCSLLAAPSWRNIKEISGCRHSWEDVTTLRQHGKDAQSLATLSAGWCEFAAQSKETPELDALASYDEEMLDNLQMYWRHPSKINSPITDNLFELRREVVDEAHGGKLVAAWSAAQQARLEQIMVGSLRGGISSALWKWSPPIG